MRTRPLTTGLPPVTVIGLGDVSLATAASRGIDHREAERAVHEAIELGITLVDVSADTDAERMVGDAVRTFRARDRVVVACHVPLTVERPGAAQRDGLPERLPAPWIQERVEASLRATRLDAVPLAQLPLRTAWRRSSAWAEVAGTCARLVDEGKVLAWGAIVDEAALTEDTIQLASGPFTTLAVAFAMCDRRATALIEAARERRIAILARRPLAGGALTGNLGPGVKLVPRDDRHALDDATLETIAVGAAKLAALVKRDPPAVRSCEASRAARALAPRPTELTVMTVAELALRWTIDQPGVTAILPRLHRREHLIETLAAVIAPPLSRGLLARIDTIFPPPATPRPAET